MIRVYRYQTGGELIESAGAPALPIQDGEFLWVDLYNPDGQELAILEKDFGFHPLAVEDSVNRMQRSKIDDYGEYLFIVVHAVGDTNLLAGLDAAELALFFSHKYIVSVRWEPVQALDTVLDRIRKNNALLANPGPESLNTLFLLKRRLVSLRKILSPLREMFNILLRFEGTFFKEENRLFYLDVYDHLMRIFDFVETYRDLIGGGLEMYLTVVSNRTNEVMKILTVIATIVMPLTLISSIYGMNFRYMPELEWRYGYFAVLGFMGLLTAGMVIFFRRKKWF